MPHWIASRSIGVRVVARPGLRGEREHARRRTGRRRSRTTRTGCRGTAASGGRTARTGRGCSGGRTRPGGPAASAGLHGSVIQRFMSHLTYEIGPLPRTSARTPLEVVDDLRPAEVEDELLAALRPRPAGDADRPVRMGREQLAPLADHLRLDPDPEAEAERLDPPGEAVDPVRAACGGRRTSRRARSCRRRACRTSRRRGRTARSRGRGRPSAIATSRSSSKSKYVPSQLLTRIGRGRSRHDAAGEPLAEQAMEGVAHRAEAVGRSGRGPPRASSNSAPGARRPARTSRGRSRSGAGRPERLDLDLGEEVARVDEGDPDRLAVRPRSSPRGAGRGTGCGRATTSRECSRPTGGPCTSGRVRTCRSRAQAPPRWTSVPVGVRQVE